jgi:hypothetical protein
MRNHGMHCNNNTENRKLTILLFAKHNVQNQLRLDSALFFSFSRQQQQQ